MGKELEKINSSDIIETQLKEFNEKLLSNLPSLEWENWFGDRARDIMFLLGLDKNFNPSGYVEALAKARESQKSANNPDYKNFEKKAA
ncbi:MAG: hypothetical protein PHR68_04685 [Candidatus Gracilibacteria bacterium]|nr:hypothetical protein [Candidatus Gracilibacteria bacterium]